MLQLSASSFWSSILWSFLLLIWNLNFLINDLFLDDWQFYIIIHISFSIHKKYFKQGLCWFYRHKMVLTYVSCMSYIYLLCRNIQWCYLCFSLLNCLVLSLIEVLLFPMFFQLINFCVYYIRLSLSIQGTLNLIDSRAPFYLFWAWYYFLNLGSIILWLL